MIEYHDGTVFNTDANTLVNTVNCTGVMGAGIALEFKLRYPEMFKQYADDCKKKVYMTGKVYYQKCDDYTIINFPTKWHFKYPSKIEWIESGLKNFCNTYKKHNITSVAFPKLGTSNGGLNWDEVQPLMEKYLGSIDAKVYICLDTLSYAEGTEKRMLELFNAMSIDNLIKVVKLNKTQKEILEQKRPYNRFWKIGQTNTIGAKTYEKLFGYFYKLARSGEETCEQMDMFGNLK